MKTLNQYPKNEIDLFDGEQPDSWNRNYWRMKLKNPDVVDKISKDINSANDKTQFQPNPQQDFFHEGASVKTVLKPRNLHDETKIFFVAQNDIVKNTLPTQCTSGQDIGPNRIRMDLYDQQEHRNTDFASNDKMVMTPNEAFNTVYPYGNPIPQSTALKPTSSISGKDEHKGGYPYEGGKVGALQLDKDADTTTKISGNSTKINPIGDNYLPKNSFDSGFTPPKENLSSGDTSKAWDGMRYSDLNFQAGIGQKEAGKNFNNLGEILQKYLEEKKIKS